LDKPNTYGVGLAIQTEFILPSDIKVKPIEIRLLYGDGKEYYVYFEYVKTQSQIIFTEKVNPFL
jgi:hypothetical protein